MTDLPPATASTATPAPPAPPPPAKKKAGAFVRFFRRMLLGLVVLVAAWTWFSLTWAYSEGDRAGVLQKLSRKGVFCKTWEGELAQYVVAGVAPQIWQFSIRDDALAAKLAEQVGRNVQLHYTEHVGVPTTCFADTRFFVARFTEMSGVPSISVAPTATMPPTAVPGSPTSPAGQPASGP
jgi:hypothetical protein